MENKLLQISTKLYVSAYYPEAHLRPYILSAIDDLLLTAKDIEFNEINFQQCKCKITFKKDETPKSTSVGIIVFSSEIIVEPTLYSPDAFSSEKEFWDYMRAELSLEYFIEVKRLIIMSHLAYPGALKTNNCKVFSRYDMEQEGKFDFKSIYSLHRDILDDIRNINWPTLKTISLLSVITWFNKNDISFKKISSSRITRAINAYSHLFSDEPINNSELELTWSLVGIEALYCYKGTPNTQIVEKSQKLFGPIDSSNLPHLISIYQFRNKFVHGQKEIPPVDLELLNEEICFEDELFKATLFSITILTMTIQEMIIQNKTDLSHL